MRSGLTIALAAVSVAVVTSVLPAPAHAETFRNPRWVLVESCTLVPVRWPATYYGSRVMGYAIGDTASTDVRNDDICQGGHGWRAFGYQPSDVKREWQLWS